MLLPNLPPPVEGIRHQSHGIDAYVSQRHLGTGTLCIAESRLSWSQENSVEGLSLEYPHIAIHAISRDTSSFEHPCLYLMLDINIDDRNPSNNHVEALSDDEDEDEPQMTEIRFVPRDPSLLELMYKSLNDCQILHPDPEDQPSDEEEDDFQGDYEIGAEDPGVDGIPYEENMEGDLEYNPPECNGGGDHRGPDVEMGQFDDADFEDPRM